MPTITQLNRRHAAAQRQRRQWLLRISFASLGVLCLIGMVVRQPSSSRNIKNRDNAVSPAHLLRQQPWDVRQLKHVTTAKETSKEKTSTKKTTKTMEKEEETKTTITKTKKETNTEDEEATEDGSAEDGSVMEEFIDEEEELADEEVDGGDAEPEEPAKSDKKTKKSPTTESPPTEDPETSTAGGGQTTEDEEAEPVDELTHSEDNSASEDVESSADGDDGSEVDEGPESGDGEGEEVTTTEEPKKKKSKTKKPKKDDPKSPEEIFEEQAEEEEEAFWDAGDSGPVDDEEETEEPSRKFVFVLRNLDPNPVDGKTSGRITIVTHPEWAPIGVKHFHQLVDDGFYKGCRFFRVLPGFIAQFGINGDTEIQKEAKKAVLEDDPVEHTNAYGTLTYATAGPNTRTTQLFFNTKKEGNSFLDDQGFAPFAEIVGGIEYLARINSEYGERPNQSKITNKGQEYLNRYPNLTYIRRILEEKIEGAEDTE